MRSTRFTADVLPKGKALGCLPRSTQVGEVWPLLRDAVPLVPKSEWEARLAQAPNLASHVRKIKDQDGVGSCAANAASTTVEIARDAAGLPFVELSAASLYKQVNGGRDQGSAIDDNLEALKSVGVVPVGFWGGENNWRQREPTGFAQEAKKFRVLEWFDLPDFDSFISALFLGFPVCYGVFWEGGGHAICAVKPIKDASGWGCRFANSWGDWGEAGFGTMYEPQISRGIRAFGAWCTRVATYSEG
ncbi:MAG: hypothetical protein KKH61_06600 [Gammaproteobacteria bacterium]|nr:hypothetical protein [Gammaproteobacteria bacterium]